MGQENTMQRTAPSPAGVGAAVNATARGAAVGAPAPRADAVVDGVRLAYTDAGAGPVIVCLHAIGHGAGDFADLAGRLRADYRVIALDWPGQGCSGEDREAANAARYATLLAGFLERVGAPRPVLLGNSIGGAAALRYAAANPGPVRALVLANPGGLDRGGSGAMTRVVTGLMTRFFAAGARGARWYPGAFAVYYR